MLYEKLLGSTVFKVNVHHLKFVAQVILVCEEAMILLVRTKEVVSLLTLRYVASISQNRLNLAVAQSLNFVLQRKIQNCNLQ